MTGKHRAAEHQISATTHHEEAARYHHEASKHYQIGKDYAHAAFQALLAHGHALQAIDRGNEAGRHYAEHGGSALRKHSEAVPRSPANFVETLGPLQTDLSSAEHHNAAAYHHEQAARYHSEASGHYDRQDYAQAIRDAQVAHGHAQYSVFHGDEAAKHHVEHFGRSGPTAELT
jgi:hypothetical protein